MTARIASVLLFLAAALAPWFAGARSHVPGVIWGFSGLLSASFLFVLIHRSGRLSVPKSPLLLVAGLLGFLLFFALRGEPGFATPYSEALYRELETAHPAGFILPPWTQRLVFVGSCLLGLLAAADLSSSGGFRRRMLLVIGVSGLGVALFSVAQRMFGLGLVPWAMIEGETERHNVSFFHYSGTAACINLAWPLLVFGLLAPFRTPSRLFLALAILAVAGLALAPLGAAAGVAVAIGMAVCGSVWMLTVRRPLFQPWMPPVALAAAFIVAGLWQRNEIAKLAAEHPDGWQSARFSEQTAGARDAAFLKTARERGDRIVPSDAPARPTTWLAGARMARDHLFLGPGPGTWGVRSSLYSHDPLVNTFFHCRQFTHHDLLQTAAEWGVLAMLLWAGLWVAMMGRGLISIHESQMALSLSLAGVALHALVDFPLQMPAIQLWVALMGGLLLGSQKSKTPVPRNRGKKQGRIVSECAPRRPRRLTREESGS